MGFGALLSCDISIGILQEALIFMIWAVMCLGSTQKEFGLSNNTGHEIMETQILRFLHFSSKNKGLGALLGINISISIIPDAPFFLESVA